jgi:hypothetical protein
MFLDFRLFLIKELWDICFLCGEISPIWSHSLPSNLLIRLQIIQDYAIKFNYAFISLLYIFESWYPKAKYYLHKYTYSNEIQVHFGLFRAPQKSLWRKNSSSGQTSHLLLQPRIVNTAVARVARWHIVKPKIPIWVSFGVSCYGLFYGHLVNFTTIWYIFWPFGTFCGLLGTFSRFGMLNQEKSGNPGRCSSSLFALLQTW